MSGANGHFLDKQTVVPIRLAMRNVTFRVTLSRQEINKGILLVRPAFIPFIPDNETISKDQVGFVDVAGDPTPVKVVTFEQKRKGFFGSTQSNNQLLI